MTMSAGAAVLGELARQVAPDLAIVEIGVYLGGTTVALASGEARVYCVDLWDMQLPHETAKPRNKHKYEIKFNSTKAHETFLSNVAGLDVVAIKGASSEVAKAWTRPIGLLFIDGAHDTKSVTADYLGWAPHVVSGGLIAFDDAQPGTKVRGVIDGVVKPSGEWDDWREASVDGRLVIARRR